MEDTSVRKMPWGLTVTAFLGIAGVAAIAWLVSSSHSFSVLATG
jgi:hypothetical protein